MVDYNVNEYDSYFDVYSDCLKFDRSVGEHWVVPHTGRATEKFPRTIKLTQAIDGRQATPLRRMENGGQVTIF